MNVTIESNPLASAVLGIDRLRRERSEAVASHESNLKRIDSEIESFQRVMRLRSAGLDIDAIERSKAVLNVGRYAQGGDDRESVIRDAMVDIANGGPRLRVEFFGTKNYDRWSGQRCDCPYGLGPRHGSIVFSVGLTEKARRAPPLSAAEIEDALYVLSNIEAIQSAEATNG